MAYEVAQDETAELFHSKKKHRQASNYVYLCDGCTAKSSFRIQERCDVVQQVGEVSRQGCAFSHCRKPEGKKGIDAVQFSAVSVSVPLQRVGEFFIVVRIADEERLSQFFPFPSRLLVLSWILIWKISGKDSE